MSVTASADYDVRICLSRCGFDAAYQPPEVKRCPSCGAPLGSIPVSMKEEWEQRPAVLDAARAYVDAYREDWETCERERAALFAAVDAA